MEKLDQLIYKSLLWMIAFLIFMMMCVTFGQVIARYLLGQSLTWSEEIGRYIFVWITFLGTAAAIQSKGHVALNILETLLPARPSRYLATVNALLIAAVGVALIIGGLSLIRFGINQRSAALGLPMYTVYSVIPAGGLAMLYFSLRLAWQTARAKGDTQ